MIWSQNKYYYKIVKMNVPKWHIIWMNLSNKILTEKVHSTDHVEHQYIFIKLKTIKIYICAYTFNSPIYVFYIIYKSFLVIHINVIWDWLCNDECGTQDDFLLI